MTNLYKCNYIYDKIVNKIKTLSYNLLLYLKFLFYENYKIKLK